MTSFRIIPKPVNAKQLMKFVSAVDFYSKFISRFSDLAEPLRDLMKAEVFQWKNVHTKAFEKLKEELCKMVLKAFDPDQDVEISCDASSVAVGAVIRQAGQPVLIISKTLPKAEKKYSQLDREARAIVYALKRLHKYVYGRKFRIVTDHNVNLCFVSVVSVRWGLQYIVEKI